MKNVFSASAFPLLIAVALAVTGCKKGADTEHYDTAYRMAMQNEDYASATNFLYLKQAADTSDATVQDSLLKVYFLRNSWQPVLNIGQQVLKTKPTDSTTLFYVATAQQRLNKPNAALSTYQKLQENHPAPNIAYQIAALQFNMGNVGSAVSAVNAIINDNTAKGETVVIYFPMRGQQMAQVVPVQAAAYNLRGVVAQTQEKADVAAQNFKAALQMSNNFTLALQNLNSVDPAAAEEFVKAAQANAQLQNTPATGGQ